jgi:Spy/CpxP family protein refolding chaperone
MKKMAMVATAFAALAFAGAAQAQNTGGSAQRPHAEGRGRMGPGRGGMMMEQMLMKGITLSEAQQAKIDSLRTAERAGAQGERGQGRGDFAAIREAREKGDTATANKLMAEARTKMEAQRDAHLAAVRALLTPEQQKQFDANVAEMKQHQGERGRGRGMRPDGARKPQS